MDFGTNYKVIVEAVNSDKKQKVKEMTITGGFPIEGTCYDEGTMYNIGEQWQKEYLGDICSCTCLGGLQGWHCKNCRKPGQPGRYPVHEEDSTPARPVYVHCPVECGGPRDVLLADSLE